MAKLPCSSAAIANGPRRIEKRGFLFWKSLILKVEAPLLGQFPSGARDVRDPASIRRRRRRVSAAARRPPWTEPNISVRESSLARNARRASHPRRPRSSGAEFDSNATQFGNLPRFRQWRNESRKLHCKRAGLLIRNAIDGQRRSHFSSRGRGCGFHVSSTRLAGGRHAPAVFPHDPVSLPPLGRAVGRRHLHGRHLIFGTVRRPIRVICRDDVGLAQRMVEVGVDDAGRDAVGDFRAQRRFPGAALHAHPVAVANAGARRPDGPNPNRSFRSAIYMSYIVSDTSKRKILATRGGAEFSSGEGAAGGASQPFFVGLFSL
jgi:hypothetical protein